MTEPMSYEDRAKAVFEDWKSSGKSLPEFISNYADWATEYQERHAMAMRLQAFISDNSGQQPLIPDAVSEPVKPRKKRRVLMHEEATADGGLFRCKCGHEGGSAVGMTEAARKRGIPCPNCNAKSTGGMA